MHDAHRHLGVLPAFPFYGGPPVNPDTTARATIAQLRADMDREGTEAALVIPNYGVPDPGASFAPTSWSSRPPRPTPGSVPGCGPALDRRTPQRRRRPSRWPASGGVSALKLSFLLGGRPTDEDFRPALDRIFGAAREHGLVVHVHTSPGAASDIDEVGLLVEHRWCSARWTTPSCPPWSRVPRCSRSLAFGHDWDAAAAAHLHLYRSLA